MLWTRLAQGLAGPVRKALKYFDPTRIAMAKHLQNAQTQCGIKLSLDYEDDGLMILVTNRTWTPVPENFDQEPVAWFEPFEDPSEEVSVLIYIRSTKESQGVCHI